ncbi:HAD-IIIA family hydrolase [Dactylosporangium sp. CA-139066]|uniref:HAD-IIIA family hydrolase n=1 Tax=Dactylosporangium sp. CA-139066 TaxID=3239930 RepID=UPI003D91D6D5
MNSSDGANLVRRRLTESLDTIGRVLASPCVEQAVLVADSIVAALSRGGKVLFFGNGGSAVDAGHLAAELLGRMAHDRPALAAVNLADHTAAVTAIANDFGYDEVFARQVEALGRPGDVAVGLSTSGESANVVRALRRARELGLVTVAMTGATGGRVDDVADICIRVPSRQTPYVQEAYMHLGHSICELVEAGMQIPAPRGNRWSPRLGRPPATIFLDRDGTLNHKAPDGGYVTSPEALRLLPGVGAAVARLNRAGVRVIVVTNQRGVARGLMSEETLASTHRRLQTMLAEHGGSLDRIYSCPHELGVCGCRKPKAGLLLRAAGDDPSIDLADAVMVGDAESDVIAGIRAGTATVRLAGTPGSSIADVVLPDLPAAVAWLLPAGSSR